MWQEKPTPYFGCPYFGYPTPCNLLNFLAKSYTYMIFKDCLNMLTLCTLGLTIKREIISKILEHVEQELQSFFELLVPSAIWLRSLLYGRQASYNKTTIQKIKIKEKIADLKVYLTSNEAIFSYIDKIYIEKFNKYIYYHWVVKSMKSSLVQRRKGITSSG